MIDTTVACVNAAIDAAHAWRKTQVRKFTLGVLAGDHELSGNVEDREEVLVERELRIIGEYAELKTVIDVAPAIVATPERSC